MSIYDIIICILVVGLFAAKGLLFRVVFEPSMYESIDDVVFYGSDLELDKETKSDLELIGKQMKEKYPDKAILYLRDLGSIDMYNADSVYRCVQIANDRTFEDSDMNVWLNADGSIGVDFLVGCQWSETNVVNDVLISEKQAKEITKDYFDEHPSSLNELYKAMSFPVTCKTELTGYENKLVWKMNFSVGGSYIMIDASNGNIIKTYIFSGTYN